MQKMKTITKQTSEELPTFVLMVCFLIILLSPLLSFIPILSGKQAERNNTNYTSTASNLFYSGIDNISNKRKLTVEQVRSNKALTNISDVEAEEIIDGMYKLSIITYNIFKYGTGKL